MSANAAVPGGDEVYKPEAVATNLERIPLNLIDDDPENFELIREFLLGIGRRDLIGNGAQHLVPWGKATKPVGKRFARR